MRNNHHIICNWITTPNAQWVETKIRIRYQIWKKNLRHGPARTTSAPVLKLTGPWNPDDELMMNFVIAKWQAKVRKAVDAERQENPLYWEQVAVHWHRRLERLGWTPKELEKMSVYYVNKCLENLEERKTRKNCK